MFQSKIILCLCSLWILCSSYAQEPATEAVDGTATSVSTSSNPPLLDARDYSYAYWLNGFRKNKDDHSADLLCFETGHFGFALDLANLPQARFGQSNNTQRGYLGGLNNTTSQIAQLAPAELLIQLGSSKRVFTAQRSVTGPRNVARRLQDNRMWESGRYMQHYDMQHIILEDDAGNSISCDARLDIAAWPKSLTLTATITPELPFMNGPTIGLVGNGHNVVDAPLEISPPENIDSETFTLECWVKVPLNTSRPNQGVLLSMNGSDTDDGHIGFSIRNDRIDASMNIGGNHRNRKTLREQKHRLFKLDEWCHLAVSYDGQTMNFYVNGHLESSQAIGKARKLGPSTFKLGGSTYATFDQIRFWNRALSLDEIEDHQAKPAELATSNGLNFEKTFDAPTDPAPLQYLWQDVSMRMQLKTQGQTWEVRAPSVETWEMGVTRELILNCQVVQDKVSNKQPEIALTTADGKNVPVTFEENLNTHVAEVKKLKRTWKTGYTDIRNYDEFTVTVNNTDNNKRSVPFMLYLRDVANITGLCPMLCDADGKPTGIPVQLSKNWHYGKLGAYLRAYTLLPAKPGKTEYTLRIAYGFYGTLPSASHAQLSLVGYGGNGRWDQLAIGCWGETICFDMDRSCVDVAITDVRMLMARTGANGKKWNWTDAGWGGDWLQVSDASGQRHHPAEFKTAYLAHGPCLTDVRYDGKYGAAREVDVSAKVQTLRTDDYVRTFQKFRYTFDQEVSAKGAWLFKMGRTSNYAVPTIAYGNANGLIANKDVPSSLKKGEDFIAQTTIEGNAPWWFSFPGAYKNPADEKGPGYRALVIRGYKTTLSGKEYNNPTISVPVYQVLRDGAINLDLLLTAPKGVEAFLPGDMIEMDLEWITLHRQADDYYGPNETYRQHLTENPSSWKTTYREAIGNDLKIHVTGGQLINRYPIEIQAQSGQEIRVSIEGGVGAVPIQFDGLPSATGYTLYQVVNGKEIKLDQSVHGNDFWQVDYDAAKNNYKFTYNLELDNFATSHWIFKMD
ncbi:MAG: LamG domain-containing protein [Opitutales bacterium]|nr:LamG domain-containing protein [Opitutales bacterium]